MLPDRLWLIKVISVGGDKAIVIRCGGVAFDVAGGRGKSKLVVDPEQTEVLGTSPSDLEHERFDMTIAPKPKEKAATPQRAPGKRMFASPIQRCVPLETP
ncbi:MAG: hypothetical protein ABWZ88_08175 [Variovorax sp.]